MLIAIVPMLYFYPPSAIWSFLTFSDNSQLSGSEYWIYTVCVVVVFLDVAVIRHLLCRYMCIYRVWQHTFKTRDTLRIQYDATRSDDCSNCNYCADNCFVDIDPRNTETYDSCVNCGECIVACDDLHARGSKRQGGSLLSFVVGRGDARKPVLGSLGGFMGRAKTALLFTLIGGGMFVYGLVNYQPASLSVYRSEAWQGDDLLAYRIDVANKLYAPMTVSLRLEGLPPGSFEMAQKSIHFDRPGRKDVALKMNKKMLSKGLHRFRVIASDDHGWSKAFVVVHYAAGNDVATR